MLCERCGIREANIQYTEVINGVKKEHHFCANVQKRWILDRIPLF